MLSRWDYILDMNYRCARIAAMPYAGGATPKKTCVNIEAQRQKRTGTRPHFQCEIYTVVISDLAATGIFTSILKLLRLC